MGDLVHSERSGAVAALHEVFNAAVERQNQERRDVLASPLTITLGDEFQGLATSLAAAGPMVRDMRLELLGQGIDCRFAIGIVGLKTPLNTQRAWNMMGSGLAETREKLEEKRTTTLYRFAFAEARLIECLLEALGAGLTAIERRWTPQQRQDIAATLAGASAAEIAERRKVSAHSVYKVRASGEFDLYASHWKAIDGALAQLDRMCGVGR